MTKPDRLVKAWELRRDVHAWISSHPGAAMPEIKRAFGSIEAETIRYVVKRICLGGFIRVDKHRYWVEREFDQSVDEMRDRLRKVGVAASAALVEGNRTRARLADGTFAPGPVVMLGRRYINRPWKKQPIQNQGGQGACVELGRRREAVC